MKSGGPLVSKMIDSGIALPPLVATLTDITFDDILAKNLSGKSVGKWEIGKEFRFNGIASFAIAAVRGLLYIINEESPYLGLRPRSTINTPVIYTSSLLVKSRKVRERIPRWYRYSKCLCRVLEFRFAT